MLVDRHGRPTTDLRVSVTRRCNFDCTFCHNEGLGDVLGPQGPSGDEMTVDHVARLVQTAHDLGIRVVKFTGGEPLLRRDLEQMIAAVPDGIDVGLTTNGSMLAPRADALRDAGLDRVNVSLHSLDEEAFHHISQGHLEPVLDGLEAALVAGFDRVKVNCVVMDRTVDHLPDLLDLARAEADRDLVLQLIELMPEIRHDMAPHRVDIDRVHGWLADRADRVTERRVHHRPIYHVDGARVEVVAPVGNAEFCANCHRIRVTHKGELKGCLNVDDDLVPTKGLEGDELVEAFRECVRRREPYYTPGDEEPGSATAGEELPVIG